MSESILSPTFVFRFSIPCFYSKTPWSTSGLQLDEKYALPSFGELEERPMFADLRMAWNEQGLAFVLRVTGKKQLPWCRPTRLEDSDGLRVWIDTRDTHNVHRASRFCHQFMFMPMGGGKRLDQPVAELLPIDRAREMPKPLDNTELQVRSEKRVDGYLLQARIPTEALTGLDAEEHPKLGFFYAVADRELGWQTFSVGAEFPIHYDPSLWGTLELVPD